MNRTIREAAQVLGVSETRLRDHLRGTNAVNRDGSLAAKHIGGGKLFMDPRVTTPKHFGRPKHYAVLMVTEQGIDWLASQLGVAITNIPSKDSAA
jgi:hypothetical protein